MITGPWEILLQGYLVRLWGRWLILEPQIYKGEPRTCAILIPAWGSNLGYSGFSLNENNRGSSGAHVTCIYCDLSMKINKRWNATRHEKIVGAHVLRLWSAKTRIPSIWAHGWQCHYTGWYTRSGISLLYLCHQPKQWSLGLCCKDTWSDYEVGDYSWS